MNTPLCHVRYLCIETGIQLNVTDSNTLAVIEINSPPVNAISRQLRAELLILFQSLASQNLHSVLLTCAGRTFVAGADIKEMDTEPLEPHLPELIAAIARFPKPVIAVLHGTVLGGGLELALACDYRLAVSKTKLGLPEVNLGIIPGAGGTLRLMNLIGAEAAIEFACTGKPQNADEWLNTPLIHKLMHKGNLTEQTLNFCRQLTLAEDKHSLTKGKQNTEADFSIQGQYIDWDSTEKKVKRLAKGVEAPVLLLNEIKAIYSLGLSFEHALKRQRRLFLQLRDSDQAKALRYAFFTEKKNQKLATSTSSTRAINTVGVVGAGNMGVGIARCFIDAGMDLIWIEQTEEALLRGMDNLRKGYQSKITKGHMTEQDLDDKLQLIQGTTDYDRLAPCDLVVEAAFEDLEVKKIIFKALDQHCKDSAILATNTSYLDINSIAKVTCKPEQVVGLHFFSPAHVMKLIEIVRAENTADDVIETMLALGVRLRKYPVEVGVCFGFAANRMYTRYGREIQQMLLEGNSIVAIDEAMTSFGMAMGPLAVQDLSGIDIGYQARAKQAARPYDLGYFRPSASMVENGRLGRKTQAGFYQYLASGEKVESQEAQLLVDNEAKKFSITPHLLTAEAIQQRAMLALVSEGLLIIDEGIVNDISLLDIIWLHGYGFPRFKGGPMYWGAKLGCADIDEKLQLLRHQYGADIWPEVTLSHLK